MKADMVAAGLTTPYDDPLGLTAYDRLVLMAYDQDGYDWGFSADDAQEIVVSLHRLAMAAGFTIAAEG